MPSWLKDAVFYEIYPQSFYDTNGDGIGDLKGIEEKLDYVKSLGCNALWINPCFDSPFKDAGYDVRDYKKIAPRYGTNEDMAHLLMTAHEKGIKVLLDLVPGHTSEEHQWFVESKKAERNEFSDRYVWTDFAFAGIPDHPYIGGESERGGCYMLNFFKCQPALNYGFGKVQYPWQKSYDSPEAIATREALKDTMRFWLDMGCDGFRVDMADSLVKDDEDGKPYTSLIWKNIREMLDQEYPDAALVSEWCDPPHALPAGFHMDFLLDHNGDCYNELLREYEAEDENNQPLKEGENEEERRTKIDHSYFKASSDGHISAFLRNYMNYYYGSKESGYMSLLTCNHDTPRAKRTLTDDELKLAYAFIFTMPGVPFLYYGDEIGMKYLNIPTKEGGYHRTGSRTPMQWNHEKNFGFSTADEKDIYLQQDKSADSPTVEDQEADENSLLNTVKAVISLRHEHEDLQADGSFSVIHASTNDRTFVYRRGKLVIAVNPSLNEEKISLDDVTESNAIYSIGSALIADSVLDIKPQSFVVFNF